MADRENTPWPFDVPIPKDDAERRALYDEADLTDEERFAVEWWVRSQERTKDPLHILSNEQYDQLHADLAEMAKQRRRVEAESAWIPMH